MAQERARWYQPIDAAVLRASVHTGDVIPRPWPELDDDSRIEQRCRWLAQAWAQQPVAEAVAVASPVLADRIEAVCAGLRPGARQVRRLVMALARYLVRMRGRATPFGAFAGVAALRFGQEVSVRWTDRHQAWTRADAVWLADVITRLESCVALRRRLPVMVNDLVLERGERLVVTWPPHAGDSGRNSSGEVSLRYAPPVQTIMQVARSPGAVVPVEQLVDSTAGLGFPCHFGTTGQSALAGELSGRDEWLLALAQQAALDGAQEVVLDDDALDALTVVGRDEARSVPHVDVWVEVRAPTTTALTEGAFTLAVCGIGRTGAATGRFLDLLPVTDRHRMVGLHGQLPTGVDGALATQLSFPPKHPRVENASAPRSCCRM